MSDSGKQSVKLPPEQQAILDRCFHPSGTFVEFPIEDVETSIPARFEKIVRMYPDRLAVKMASRALTYYELNQAANRIARAIVAKRGQRSEPIVILFENGIDVIAATLGALKSGRSYVAIDPSFTNERIVHMLDDCQAGLLVTNQRNIELSQKLINDARTLLDIDEIDDSRVCDDLNLPISPDDVASIVYTSGSTGGPKGVAHSHRSQLHDVMVKTNATRISFQDRLTLLHSVGFGSARAHLFQSLLNGASLCFFDFKSEGIYRLSKWLNEEDITVYHSTLGVFRQLAEIMPEEEKYTHLRLIRLTGAPVNRLEFDLYKKKFAPGTLLQTVMNSTEARVICSFVTDGSFSFPKIGCPVGYPVPGKTVFLLDENGHEVGLGQVGEIAVKSRYLASGYWRMPELTKAKFLPDPNGGDERICLTGDLGTKLPDGFLIHLGRKDFMVKIRGYRVELGEIERALLTHPEVKDAGVVAWDQEPGEKYLVAYVVPRESNALTVNELRGFLKEKLPDYMIPAIFMFLDSLPLTNGKLDRTALPRPDHKRPNLQQPYAPPQDEVETRLVQIWEEILNVRPIGIHDNFFDLGGHSLAATRVISRLIQTFQLELPVKALFDAPTVAEMAAIITENQAKRASDSELAQMLREVETMSEEEAQKLLAGESARGSTGDGHE
jgi:amino acid adenylation domain-containing protein